MFDLFFRRFIPGFRLRPQDDVPGFDIDENGLPWSDGILRDPVTQRYPDAAPTPTPHPFGFPTPAPNGLVQSAPPIGLAGVRVSPQEDVPGFNLDEEGVQQQEATWFDGMRPESVTPRYFNFVQTPAPAPSGEPPAPPLPSQLPEGLYRLLSVLLPRLATAFDPRPERRVAITWPDVGPAAMPGADPWPSSSAPRQPATDIARGATPQDANPQPAVRQAMQNDGFQPPMNARPHVQGDGALPSMAPIRRPADANFSLAKDQGIGEQEEPNQRPLQQYQPTQPGMPSARAGLATVSRPEKASINSAGLEREPAQETAELDEAHRRLEEAEGLRFTAGQGSPSPRVLQNTSRRDELGPMGAAQARMQVEEPQAAQIDPSSHDAAGLPNGAIVSSIGSADASTARWPLPADLKLLLVGDEDKPSDLDQNVRHQLGVAASIEMHLKRGFEVPVPKPRLVDVPGFPKPRYYDYIIRDPLTNRHYGVEVKTTLYDTIRLDPSQVMKDVVVAAGGATVRTMDLKLDGVAYSTFCFACKVVDLRSLVLLRLLQNAGVPISWGTLPGDIRP